MADIGCNSVVYNMEFTGRFCEHVVGGSGVLNAE